MRPKHAYGVANSVDPDQTAPSGAVWSVSALFAQTCQNTESAYSSQFHEMCPQVTVKCNQIT